MSAAPAILVDIARRQSPVVAPRGEAIELSVLMSLHEAIGAHGDTVLHRALADTLVRLAETQLFCHPRMVELGQYWDNYVGRGRDTVRAEIASIISAEPPDALIEHIYRCLNGAASRIARGSGEHDRSFPDVLARLRAAGAASGAVELRCECCGYHFRKGDLGSRSRRIMEAGFALSEYLSPGRPNDPYKPVQSRKGQHSYLTMTVDHIVPEETLGWSEEDNLALLCSFCNQGKAAFRWPLEAITTFAVGALADLPAGRDFAIFKHQIVVATLRAQGAICGSCGRERHEAEMTVRPVQDLGPGTVHGFAPWNLRTICYRCLSAEED